MRALFAAVFALTLASMAHAQLCLVPAATPLSSDEQNSEDAIQIGSEELMWQGGVCDIASAEGDVIRGVCTVESGGVFFEIARTGNQAAVKWGDAPAEPYRACVQ